MNSYNIDLAKTLSPNKQITLSLTQPRKGPLKPITITAFKENDVRTHFIYQKPQNINIAGQNIKKVYDYSVVKYKDAATQNGKLYDITTDKSRISLYTHDNKFALMEETYRQPRTLNIGNYKLKGDVTKSIKADGSKEYSVITSHYKIKKINISPEGIITGPKKSLLELIQNKLVQKINNNKFISKLLKKF